MSGHGIPHQSTKHMTRRCSISSPSPPRNPAWVALPGAAWQ
uniref:Uncharacterized protein n=1 Tax=uncultured bacterium A1Q1_fos_1134 TaxID=1256543 RepID=L7VZS3_9BACT|nr:hypothetical protein [uncultured bacterium A1Q1_fos_1134]